MPVTSTTQTAATSQTDQAQATAQMMADAQAASAIITAAKIKFDTAKNADDAAASTAQRATQLPR